MATTLALRLERLFFPPVPTMPTAVSDWLPSLCSSLYISPLTLVLLVILPEVPIRLPCILGVNVLHLQSKNKHVNLFVQQCFQKSFFFFLIKKSIVSLDNFSFFWFTNIRLIWVLLRIYVSSIVICASREKKEMNAFPIAYQSDTGNTEKSCVTLLHISPENRKQQF